MTTARGQAVSILPHGGTLVDRVLRGPLRDSALALTETLPCIPLSTTAVSDVDLIAHGVVSPLTGFMDQDSYESVVSEMRLPDGIVWPIPITLDVDADLADTISLGDHKRCMVQLRTPIRVWLVFMRKGTCCLAVRSG